MTERHPSRTAALGSNDRPGDEVLPDRLAPADIPVVILAGGFGTRMGRDSDGLPKPLVPIGDQPILWHIMKLYGAHGFRRFVICLGYKSWLIKEYFLTYRERLSDIRLELSEEHEPEFLNQIADEDWEITLAETGLRTGTGGRLGRVERYVDADTFCFTYGDGIGAVDLTAGLAHHYDQGRIGTVTGVHPGSRYGEMHVDGAKVTEFNEKPTQAEGFVSGGFFFFQREMFRYVSGDVDLFFESEPLQHLARDGELSVFPHEGFWLGMDTYRELEQLNDLWESGEAPWKVW